MSGLVPAVAGGGVIHSESGFAFSNRDSVESLPALVRALEPHKAAAALAEYAGIGLRAAELALAGDSALSRQSLINMLRSRIGDRVLEFILGDPAPAWRRAELRLMGVADLERQLEQLEQQRRHLTALLESRR